MLDFTEENVSKMIEDEINPALRQHSGYVDVIAIESIEDTYQVVLQFYGGCHKCPSSIGATLHSIQAYLQEEFQMPALTVVNVETL